MTSTRSTFTDWYEYLGITPDKTSTTSLDEINDILILKKSRVEASNKAPEEKEPLLVSINKCMRVFHDEAGRKRYDAELAAYLDSIKPPPTLQELKEIEEKKIAAFIAGVPLLHQSGKLWHQFKWLISQHPFSELSHRGIQFFDYSHPYTERESHIQQIAADQLTSMLLEDTEKMKHFVVTLLLQPTFNNVDIGHQLYAFFSSTGVNNGSAIQARMYTLIAEDEEINDLYIKANLKEIEYDKQCNDEEVGSLPALTIHGVFNIAALLEATNKVYHANQPGLKDTAFTKIFANPYFLASIVRSDEYTSVPHKVITKKLSVNVKDHARSVKPDYKSAIFDDGITYYKKGQRDVHYSKHNLQPVMGYIKIHFPERAESIAINILATPTLLKEIGYTHPFWRFFSPAIVNQVTELRKQANIAYAKEFYELTLETLTAYIGIKSRSIVDISNAPTVASKARITLFGEAENKKGLKRADIYLQLLSNAHDSPIQQLMVISAILANGNSKVLKELMHKITSFEVVMQRLFDALELSHGGKVPFTPEDFKKKVLEPLNKKADAPGDVDTGHTQNVMALFKPELDSMHQMRGEEMIMVAPPESAVQLRA
jgi:hypothetical protein